MTMTTTPPTNSPSSDGDGLIRPTASQARTGPPAAAPAIAFAVLTVATAVVGANTPRPTTSATDVVAYLTAHDTAATLTAVGLALSVIPLAILGATLVSRWRALGVSGTPGPMMGMAGGILAGASLTLSASATWAAVQTAHDGSPGMSRALSSIGFAAGSAGFAAPLGLMVAGTAVPALITRTLPRWLAVAGAAVAAIGMLSTFALALPALSPMFPIARFGGLLFLVAAAFLLPARREPRRTSTGGVTP